jgi:hypothetical protein
VNDYDPSPPPDGATVHGVLYWRYDADRRIWIGRKDADGTLVKRRRWGSRGSDWLWHLWIEQGRQTT